MVMEMDPGGGGTQGDEHVAVAGDVSSSASTPLAAKGQATPSSTANHDPPLS